MKIATQYLSNYDVEKILTFGTGISVLILFASCFVFVFVIPFFILHCFPGIKIMGPIISIPAGAIYPHCPHLKKKCAPEYVHTYI